MKVVRQLIHLLMEDPRVPIGVALAIVVVLILRGLHVAALIEEAAYLALLLATFAWSVTVGARRADRP